MKKILVTGATGFVGQALCKQLIIKGYQVTAAVRNIDKSLPKTITQIVIGRINGKTNWNAALQDVTTVIHLAARTHVTKETAANSLELFRETNVAGTERLTQQAIEHGVNRLIFMSSIKVNGEATTNVPFQANDVPKPNSAYGISKLEAEKCLQNFAAQNKITIVIIRPPLIYGPHAKANFQNLLKIVKSKIPLPFGLINNKRSLIGINNLVDFTLLCVEKSAADNQTFLVADDNDISTKDLIKKMAKLFGYSAHLVPVPPQLLKLLFKLIGKSRIYDKTCSSLQLDISKSKQMLNWQPKYSLDNELRKTVDWYLAQKTSKRAKSC